MEYLILGISRANKPLSQGEKKMNKREYKVLSSNYRAIKNNGRRISNKSFPIWSNSEDDYNFQIADFVIYHVYGDRVDFIK